MSSIESRKFLLEALVYIMRAEKMQKSLLKRSSKVEGGESMNYAQKQVENSVILAYRYFTHGIITMNYFVMD